MLVYYDIHTGVARWRERWVQRTGGRWKGVWDSALKREELSLNDGRALTYFLDGPSLELKKPCIFVFHAMLLSGNCFLMSEAPKNYTLVCVNRPGYYGSSPVGEEYSYERFASDIEQLADHLGLDKFIVAGHSSGGPCALACAAHLPQRVTAVGILSGDPEYAHDGVPDKRWINACCLGYFLPFVLQRLVCCLPMARHGYRGLQNDFRLENSLYSFRTESVKQNTLVFVAEKDNILPTEVSRHVHERLGNARLRTIPSVGHLGLLRDDILQLLFEALVRVSPGSEIATGSDPSTCPNSFEIC
jgi:pimeloyl-ACP methyl ester carboxylesterase